MSASNSFKIWPALKMVEPWLSYCRITGVFTPFSSWQSSCARGPFAANACQFQRATVDEWIACRATFPEINAAFKEKSARILSLRHVSQSRGHGQRMKQRDFAKNSIRSFFILPQPWKQRQCQRKACRESSGIYPIDHRPLFVIALDLCFVPQRRKRRRRRSSQLSKPRNYRSSDAGKRDTRKKRRESSAATKPRKANGPGW